MQQSPDLSNIRIRYSETGALAADQCFGTIAEFDAALRAASFAAPNDGTYFKVAFVVTWTDGGTYEGRIDLERHEYVGLVSHAAAFCADVESDPHFSDLVRPARIVRARLLHSAAQERVAVLVAREKELAAELERQRAELGAIRARVAD